MIFQRTCLKNGFWELKLGVKIGGDYNCRNQLRSLFNDALSFFLREVCVHKEPRPLPVFLGDGKPVDLFKLFWMVRKRGGYDVVSRNELWDFVAEECELTIGVLAAIKLIYVKYLIEFDQWICQVKRDNNLENEEVGVLQKLDLLVRELEGFRFSASRGKDILINESEIVNFKPIDRLREKIIRLRDRNNSEIMEKEVEGNDSQVDAAKGKHKLYNLYLLSGGGKNKKEQKVALRIRDGEEKCDIKDNDGKYNIDDINIISCAKNVVGKELGSQKDNQSVFPVKGVVERVFGSHKRKRESSLSLLPMLSWLAHAARNSNDPAVGIIPESSRWNDYGSEELWKQALLARKALMIRRHVDSSIEESLLQNKVRMHPSMYEDNNILNRQSSEPIRSSKRVPLAKPSLCPCCKSYSTPCKKEVENRPSKERDPTPCKKEVENRPSKERDPTPCKKEVDNRSIKERDSTEVEPLTPDMRTAASIYKPRVGPLFQAKVPAWTGVVFESDSKWLGTRVWPPLDEQKNVARNGMGPIGKGRESSCLCRLPGSTDCVRFHIAENRIKLSRELGPVFHRWKFSRMGEEVSLSWTIEEEKKFKIMVKSNTNSINKFWRNAYKIFPKKNREKLVSYYFNVYVIRRRSYQNRVTPNEIDSDDDEAEVGAIGDSFGYEKIHPPRIKCSQNMQCRDFDYNI